MRKRKKHISKGELRHIAWLARIELSKKEEELFATQLNDILEYFKKIDEVATEGVHPTYHVLELVNVWRPDKVEPFSSEDILQNVPKLKERYVKGPRIG